MRAFYFTRPDERLGYNDGRHVRVGITHTVSGTPEICVHGLHGSVRVIDALKYAQSSILYIVDITGNIDIGEDKIAGNNRQYLQRIDVEGILREFVRRQALINIEKIRPYCSERDFSLIYSYLTTGNPSLRSAARSAAWSAARSAARSVAGSAARSAARSAAWSAAWSAACIEAWNAAWSAAESAARSAAWSAVESAACIEAWSAVESVAWSAAWNAAESAADTMLTEMIQKELSSRS